MADPTVEQEVKEQFNDAVAGMPFLLRYTTGEVTSLDEVSTNEHMHGLQLLIFELARITERLARRHYVGLARGERVTTLTGY